MLVHCTLTFDNDFQYPKMPARFSEVTPLHSRGWDLASILNLCLSRDRLAQEQQSTFIICMAVDKENKYLKITTAKHSTSRERT